MSRTKHISQRLSPAQELATESSSMTPDLIGIAGSRYFDSDRQSVKKTFQTFAYDIDMYEFIHMKATINNVHASALDSAAPPQMV